VTELRWILAAACAVLLLGIVWWGRRRSAQAPGRSELREPTVNTAEAVAAEPREFGPATRDRRASPLEPLSIKTAQFEEFELDTKPMIPTLRPVDAIPSEARGASAAATAAAAPTTAAPADSSPRAVAPAARVGAADEPAPAAEMKRIVTLRISALKDAPWNGVDLMTALEDHGLAHGRYQVFHRKHADGRTMFCAASLVEPGSFDLALMPRQEFRGVSLFAILPGPLPPAQTFDAMLGAAEELALALNGVVQDAAGQPLTPERTAALRLEVDG
jgi:FtsZ-interacting cell division protein ZipA